MITLFLYELISKIKIKLKNLIKYFFNFIRFMMEKNFFKPMEYNFFLKNRFLINE